MVIKIENRLNWSDDYPIFLSENYLKTESSEYGWIMGYIDGKLEVILPYFIYTKLFFRLLRFTNEPYFLDKKLKEKYEQDFLEKLLTEVATLKIDLIMQPTTNVVFDNVPEQSTYAPFGTYRLDLRVDEEILWKNLHSKHRNVIRNAEKKGITVVENDYDENEIYDLINETFSRSSMGFMSREKFQHQLKNLNKNVRVFVARTEDGLLQGCAVIPYSSHSGYYLHGGSVSRPLTGAMNFLQYKVMLSLKESGVEQYDFVGARINVKKGTKLEGIQKFKERFGATLHKGYMWKHPIRPFKAKLFEFIYKLLKKSEGDIIDQERNR
jgi:lipid II:glycine glycyltransferase (peptidoglycan interpeptide bridge formation enzyme)